MYKRFSLREGFTLIELLVVIAIIGILAAVILASLNSAREKSKDAAIRQQVLEFSKLMALEYSDNGSYANLNKGWVGSNTCESKNYAGNYADQAVAICNGIRNITGTVGNQFYTGVNVGAGYSASNSFSIMATLSNGNLFCAGSSGSTYDGPPNPGSGTYTAAECYSNP